MTGIVKWFSPQKGYGFILAIGGKDVFVHHSAIMAKGFRTLSPGDSVEFEMVEDQRGARAEKLIVCKHAEEVTASKAFHD